MKDNLIQTKSFDFAVSVVNAYKFLVSEKKEFILSKQLLRSGTSVGANIREAQHAQSKKDFIHKLSISQKEVNETIYWLDLLIATSYLKESDLPLKNNAVEILKILTSIIKTSKLS